MNNRRFFNLTARGYDFITRQKLWRDQIGQTLGFVDDRASVQRVLDLGCGPGISSFVLAAKLPGASVVGIDLSDRMIDRARRHHGRHHSHLKNLEFRQADVYELPFSEKTFDFAVGHSFLYLLPHRTRALKAIAHVLQKEGRLVLMEPRESGSLIRAARRARWNPLSVRVDAALRFGISMISWRIVSRGRGQMRADELRELFEAADFQDISVIPTLGGLGLHATGVRR